MARVLGIVAALLLHTGFLLFGGLIFGRDKDDKGTLQQVELVGDESVEKAKEPEKPKETVQEPHEELQAESEAAPDAEEIIRDIERSAVADAPALDAASLGAIEAALGGGPGSGDFAAAFDFASGGRIGGTGKLEAQDTGVEGAFSLAEIDQKPRALFQTAPLYPAELHGKKLEGVVTLIFVVDAAGKVAGARVEKSTHPAFEKPALDALKQWKFEPAVKGGQRVDCKMRVPIRFQPSEA